MKNDISDNKTPAGATPKTGDNPAALPPLSVEILRWLKKKESMNIRGLGDEIWTRRSSLKVHLRNLVRAGLIRRHGKGKATWYTL